MEVIDLFPTPVSWFELGRTITDKELEFITNQPTRVNVGNTSSINTYILESAELVELKTFFEKSLEQYFQKVYAPKSGTGIRITQSWINYTNPGQYHHKHTHPNSFISGVFYVKTNPETDRIYFCNDNYKQLKLDSNKSNIYNTDSWWFNSVAGCLILFPSELPHMVNNTDSQGDTRISISFNTFPTGTLGSKYELTEVFL